MMKNKKKKIYKKELIDVTQFSADEPAFTFACFINAIIEDDFEKALKYTQLSWRDTVSGNPLEELMQFYGALEYIQCLFITYSTMDHDKDLDKRLWRDVNFGLVVRHPNKPVQKLKMRARLIKEDATRSTSLNGRWGVNPVSSLRMIGRIY